MKRTSGVYRPRVCNITRTKTSFISQRERKIEGDREREGDKRKMKGRGIERERVKGRR